MKPTKQQLALSYYKEHVEGVPLTQDEVIGAFEAGFDAAQKTNWTTELPNDDTRVIAYIKNLKVPWWSCHKIGVYMNDKWYFEDGYDQSKEKVVEWFIIPEREVELKTFSGWCEEFQRPYTETENPQEKITERQFFEQLIQIEDYGG
jgi:hypothetical protein